jgi:hypothetical protein
LVSASDSEIEGGMFIFLEESIVLGIIEFEKSERLLKPR